MPFNPRLARLATEYTKLMNLAGRSRFIKIEPINVQPGWPPERYIITFTCKGIAGIDGDENPISSNFHQVEMYMGRDYPDQEPFLKWLTPIWHPNIEHAEPHKVCTNNAATWYSAKSLVDLVVAMGEMVQYRRYHAKWDYPYPLDQIAADWVVRVAEPKGIVGPDRPYDRRPLVRPRGMRNERQPRLPAQPAGGISFGSRVKREQPEPAPAAPPAAPAAPAEPPPAEPPPRTSKIVFGSKSAPAPAAPVSPAEAHGDPGSNGDAVAAEPESGDGSLLEVWRDGSRLFVSRMSKPVFTIGRGGDGVEVDLMLADDESVSGLHAVLERDDYGLWLTAKGESPVRVEGKPLPRDRMVSLAGGAQIEIGDFSLRLK